LELQMLADAQMQRARELHRGGFVDEAKSIYRKLLHENPANADVIGLLAMAAFQEGKISEAETLWKKALTLNAAPSIHIRDLNNLVTTLLDEGREEDARSLLANAEIQRWAEIQPPDERELKSLMSLVLCFIRLDLSKKARSSSRISCFVLDPRSRGGQALSGA
jgi:tetratricopeptide (TPR) repeat protein